MTTRYVAFIDQGECGGFTSLENWNNNPTLREDIDDIVEFDGPDYEPDKLDTEELDRQFEELKRLSETVVNELHKLPGQ